MSKNKITWFFIRTWIKRHDLFIMCLQNIRKTKGFVEHHLTKKWYLKSKRHKHEIWTCRNIKDVIWGGASIKDNTILIKGVWNENENLNRQLFIPTLIKGHDLFIMRLQNIIKTKGFAEHHLTKEKMFKI